MLLVACLSSALLVLGAGAAESNQRYLLYDMDPGEGMNFRKDCTHRVFSLVRALGKADPTLSWTIVLPTFQNRKGHEEYPFGDFFDVKALGEAYSAIDLIEAADYITKFGKKADLNVFFRYNDSYC